MNKKEIMDALVKIGKVRDGRSPFIGSDCIGQDGLYRIQDMLLELMDKLDHERASKEFPYMYKEVVENSPLTNPAPPDK